jgi:DNA-binding HxlR family transcriptional regulator
MLSRELKVMELTNLVVRKVDPDIPTNIKYVVTDYCQTFGDILLEMIIWGKQHRKTITAGGNSNNLKNKK